MVRLFPEIGQSEQKLLGQAVEPVVLLADASKFKRRSSLLICSLDRIDILITDDRIDNASMDMLESANIKVITAGTNSVQKNRIKKPANEN